MYVYLFFQTSVWMNADTYECMHLYIYIYFRIVAIACLIYNIETLIYTVIIYFMIKLLIPLPAAPDLSRFSFFSLSHS